jgi:GPH family glycoside/pentoside/hexuronide:cation symporter
LTSAIDIDPSVTGEPGLPPHAAPQPRSISTATFFGFSLGMVGDRIFRDAPALLLLIYMTDYLAIPPAMAGVAIFIPKILIMFIDPMVGTLSDRLDTPWGRRRPLMLVGCILASLSILMFFHVPRFGAPLPQAAYMSFIVLVGFTGYSLYSVPYLTMASEMASSDQERRKIMSWRVVFMAIGLSLSAFAGGFAQSIGGGLRGYEIMSWVYAAICLITMLSTVVATGGIATAPGGLERMTLINQFRMVAGNHRYMRLVLVSFAQKLGEGVGYGSFAYFCIYVVHQPLTGIGLVVLASTAGQVLAQPFWLKASRRWSGPTLYTVGVLGWCLNLFLWLAMKDRSPLWLIPLGLQAGAAAGGFLMVTLGMLSNAMAADVAETGLNREGVYSGFWLAIEKLAFALGALVVGVVIGLFGFVESANGVHVTQTPMAIAGIAFTYCGLNMLVYLASILAVRRIKTAGGAASRPPGAPRSRRRPDRAAIARRRLS